MGIYGMVIAAGVFISAALLFYTAFLSYGMKGTSTGESQAGSVIQFEADLEKARLKADTQEKELNALNAKVQQGNTATASVLAMRGKIAAELDKMLKASNLSGEVDPATGDIRFSNSLLFETNREEINANGVDFIKRFFPAYLDVLFGAAYRNYIREVVIEGHADDDGTYLINLELSQQRAANVARVIIDNRLFGSGSINVEQILSVSGRSFSKPVTINGVIDRARSRRVEFKFNLKEDVINNEIRKNLGIGG